MDTQGSCRHAGGTDGVGTGQVGCEQGRQPCLPRAQTWTGPAVKGHRPLAVEGSGDQTELPMLLGFLCWAGSVESAEYS